MTYLLSNMNFLMLIDVCMYFSLRVFKWSSFSLLKPEEKNLLSTFIFSTKFSVGKFVDLDLWKFFFFVARGFYRYYT